MMVQLVFSKHAVEQMQKREIGVGEVEIMFDHPDGHLVQSRDKQIIYKRFPKRKNNLLAAVIVAQKAEIMEVITVMHDFEVRK